MKALTIRFLAWLFVASALSAQLASSPGFQLLDYGVDAVGGGQSSPGFVAHLSLGGGLESEDMSSPGFTAALGFLQANDPKPTLAPVIFGIAPAFGPREGGTAITISGMNFVNPGAAASTTVDVGGTFASGVVVVSDVEITAVTPAGAMGEADVLVQNVLGSASIPKGYVFTPAVTASPTVVLGGTATITNYGEVGKLFSTYWSMTATQVTTPFGELLIGPSAITPLFELVAYPGPDGISSATIPVPTSPSLSGLTVYLQSAVVHSVGPLDLELLNRAEVLVL